MTKLIMMVGLPGSGKSTISKEIAKKENAVILSSDALREELLNGANDEKYNPMIFNELYARAKNNIRNGISTILDATNAGAATRIEALKKYKKCLKECYYMSVPIKVCLERNSRRKRVVSEDVIINIYKSLIVPSKSEGFDSVYVWNDTTDLKGFKEDFEELLKNSQDYDHIFGKQTVLHNLKEIKAMILFLEDYEEYSLPINKYIYYIYEQLSKQNPSRDKYILKVAALTHGLGKPFFREFDKEALNKSYKGYESVSAQIALNLLIRMGYSAEFCLEVANVIRTQDSQVWL